MTAYTELAESNDIIATIENKENPSESVGIRYLREENAFVTSGIKTHFGEKEILIPAHLVIIDFQLIGTIVSAILEKLSLAREKDGTFDYVPRFDVLDKAYTLEKYADYMKLSVVE